MLVSRRIYDLGLPHRAVSVYCYLCDRANKNGECYPSVRTIASDLSISKKTVFRALKDLETAEMLNRTQRWRTHGGRSTNLYRLEVI